MGSIFDGTPQTASSYSSSSTETPKWMQDAIFNQVDWAQNIAKKAYEPYALPTVAELSPLQQQAFTGVENAQGAYKENFNKAQAGMEGMSTAATAGNLGKAQADYLRKDLVGQNLDAGQDLFDRAGNLDIVGAAQPLMDQAQTNAGNIVGSASPYLTTAAGMSSVDAANPYLQAGTLASGLNAASPYMNQSQSTTAQALSERALNAANPYLQQASQSSVSDINQYMNPYQQNVLDTIARQGTRNLTENLLPGVSDAFTRAGQFGSRNMGDMGSRALRDTQEAILDRQAPLAAQGYAQAMQASAADKSRQAGLAGTVGSISGADIGRTFTGADQYANLGQTAGQLTGQDAGRQIQGASTIGQLTGQDANRQSQIGQTLGQLTGQQASQFANQGQIAGQLTGQQMSQLGNLAQSRTGAGQSQQQFGLNAASQVQQAEAQDLQRQMSALQSMADMAVGDQNANYRDLAALEAVGQSQQQQMQTELSAAEKEFMDEQLYPQRNMDFLSTQIRGMAPITPQRTTTSGSTTGGTYNNSPLSQLASGYGAYKGFTSR